MSGGAYTLLENVSSKSAGKKRWVIGLTATLVSCFLFYLVYFTQSNYLFDESENLDLENTPSSIDRLVPSNARPPAPPPHPPVMPPLIGSGSNPTRSIQVKLPKQKKPYSIDLDRYPVEDNLITLFPQTVEAIKTAVIDRHLNRTVDWEERWIQKPSGQKGAYSCDQQPIPFPILQQIVADHSPRQDATEFFKSVELAEPFILLPFQGSPRLQPGEPICIRLIVPGQSVDPADPHQYKPFPKNNAALTSPWWDTTMTWLQENSTQATVPVPLAPWSGHHALRAMVRRIRNVSGNLPEWARLREDEIYERNRVHVYEAQVALPHAGDYSLASLLEFVQARYNFEDGPVTPYKPRRLAILPRGAGKIHIAGPEGLFKAHLDLPLCQGSADHPGRWLPLPSDADPAQVAGWTHHGKFWAPYHCRYRPLSYAEFNRCLARKYPQGMDIYGDSNMRRSLKTWISHGAWCKGWHQHTTGPSVPPELVPTIARRQAGYASPREYRYLIPEQTRSCACEDYTEPFWNPAWFDAGGRRVPIEVKNRPGELGATEWDGLGQSDVEDTFRISAYKWDGLTYLNSPPWQTAVEGNTVPTDIAIFSLGNWDAAFLELAPYLQDVDSLIAQIKSHYDLSRTKIIYRTPQYYCCRIDTSFRDRQVSGPRLDVFDQEVREKFVKELNAIVWDTRQLGESKTWEEKIESVVCPSNHVPADTVAIENQLLMNALCNS
ncbi:hypothetical protein BY458DRAFT_512846 [Sporodiniella umbellata]|nr:hypothetical protein BY458DRAFT_512846 [Sporodiniella umbellata]